MKWLVAMGLGTIRTTAVRIEYQVQGFKQTCTEVSAAQRINHCNSSIM